MRAVGKSLVEFDRLLIEDRDDLILGRRGEGRERQPRGDESRNRPVCARPHHHSRHIIVPNQSRVISPAWTADRGDARRWPSPPAGRSVRSRDGHCDRAPSGRRSGASPQVVQPLPQFQVEHGLLVGGARSRGFFHWAIHSFRPLMTYWLSEYRSTFEGLSSDCRPSITLVNSMRLLVVFGWPPVRSSSFLVGGCRRMNAQPPGPGLPEQAPSVNSSTCGRTC